MAAASDSLHEPDLPPEVIDRHRAIVSIMEELEAVDWYDQRVAATPDADLAGVLAHSRDEEKEHAAMTLEWLRRHDPQLDRALRTYLFSSGSLLAIEEATEHGGGGERATGDTDGAAVGSPKPGSDGSLRIGDLRESTTAVPVGGVQ